MFDRWRRQLHAFLARRSGTRFRREHRRRRARPHALRTVLAIGGGLLLLPLGMAMLVLPGPGLIVILIGAALIAGESWRVARALDRIDFHASACYGRWRAQRTQR
jgi:hypothetical protein